MPVTAEEKNVGRRSSLTSAERSYVIRGATTEAEAVTGLLATAPTTLGGLVRIDNECEVEEISLSPAIFYGRAKYSTANFGSQPPSSFHVSFDIAGTSTHITQSRASVARYPNTARDFKGTIGVSEDLSTIDGCDILIPALNFQVNYTKSESAVDESYISALMNIVGAVNTDVFKGFAIGTLLLTRVSGQQRDDKAWDLSYSFACNPNETSLTIGGITGIAKKGWEYMWVKYKTIPDGSTPPVLTKVPEAVYIEEVYRKTAYSALGI